MNYGELKTLAKDYLEVDETTFNTHLPVMVRLAEEDIYRQVQLPDLRTTATANFIPGDRLLSTPADFLSPYSLAVVNGSGVYSYLLEKDVDFMREAFPDPTVQGLPRFYSVNDDASFVVAPIPDDNYTVELNYFYLPTSLSAGLDSATTWLSENAESAILFGTIYHGYIFLKGDQDVVATYKDRFVSALADLKMIAEGRNRKDSYRTADKRIPV